MGKNQTAMAFSHELLRHSRNHNRLARSGGGCSARRSHPTVKRSADSVNDFLLVWAQDHSRLASSASVSNRFHSS
jgi:hypothetical protein